MGGLAKKQDTTEYIRQELANASIEVVMSYRGLTVAELTELRRQLYKENAKLTVVKNTLGRRVVTGTQKEGMSALFKGPTAILYGTADQVKPVKILKEFLKKIKKEKENEIRGGFLDGKTLSLAEVNELATLPPIEELRAKLLGGIASPQNGLVASLSGPQRGLVNVLDQYAKTKAGQA